MKKILFVAVLLLAALTTKAEIVSRDTVAYEGNARLEKVEKVNDYGEVSVRYVAYLLDVTNSKGEPRKVTTDRATYESGVVTHIVYNTQDSGVRKIAKALNVEAVRKNKAVKNADTAERQRDKLSDLVRMAIDMDAAFAAVAHDYCTANGLNSDDLRQWCYCY